MFPVCSSENFPDIIMKFSNTFQLILSFSNVRGLPDCHILKIQDYFSSFLFSLRGRQFKSKGGFCMYVYIPKAGEFL